MGLKEDFFERARKKNPTIVFPEAENEIIAHAALAAADEGICVPVFVGNKETVASFGVDVDKFEVHDIAADPALIEELAAVYAEREDMPVEVAVSMLQDPLAYGSMLVGAGKADGIISGYTHATADAVLAAQEYIGLAENTEIPSAYVIVEPDNFTGGEEGKLVYADPVMTVQPNAKELASVALNTAASVEKLLGWEPRVAFLSYSTKGSGGSADAMKVKEAVAITHELRPELKADGELQIDSAIIPAVSEKKIKGENILHGTANILIFPDIDAGNIGVKITTLFANGGGTFAIMCGFKRPVGEISRNSNVDGIVFSTAVTAAQC